MKDETKRFFCSSLLFDVIFFDRHFYFSDVVVVVRLPKNKNEGFTMRNHYIFCLFNMEKEKQNIIMNIRELFNNNNKNPFNIIVNNWEML